MLYLKSPPGKYLVGATSFALPLDACRKVGDANVNADNALRPALNLEEVAFTAYYPARVDKRSTYGLNWIPRPLEHSVRGYSRFSNVPTWVMGPTVYLFGRFVKIPVYHNAPLLDPKQDTESGDGVHKWPLVMFSHGLGGSRTTYSQICSRMAASGKVVLAVEHRDGTGPVVVNSRGEPKLYIQEDEWIWDPTTPQSSDPLPMRADQLKFRRKEIYQIYSAFRDLVGGVQRDADDIFKLTVLDGANVDLKCWEGAVNCEENMGLVGHSFGGATLFSVLANPPPESTDPSLPITYAVALDPWIEPFASPGPMPYLPSASAEAADSVQNKQVSSRPQLLVINGEGFTLWSEHFERLELIMQTWEPQRNRLLTVVRGRHYYFSDVNLLPFVRWRVPNAAPIMDVIAKLCIAFLEGRGEVALQEVKTRQVEIEAYEENGEKKRRLVGDVADVVVH